MASKRIKPLLVAALIAALVLSACGKAAATEDASIKITEIASTVMAELTKVAALTPSITPTLSPTLTLTPTPATPTVALATPTVKGTSSSGDNSAWDADITIPDGAMIKPGATFEKTWSVLNTGTTTWTTDYQILYQNGPQATVMSVKLKEPVAPGQKTQITVKFVAPTALGNYTSWWTMYSASGYTFGEPLSVIFVVGNDTATPTSSTPSTTPTVSTTGTVTVTVTNTP
mgnify:FL=1